MFTIDGITISIFPIEIFRKISLYLEPEYLAVCKPLLKMYDDSWYSDYLSFELTE